MELAEQVQIQDGRADFDFLIGSWDGHQRRLRARLKGSTEWEEFSSTVTARKILGGLGNFDEVIMYRKSGPMRGATLRLFDVATQTWRIYWAADNMPGILDVPMIGSFKDGRGVFHAQEIFEGKPIFSRYLWSVIDADHCRWEQAFSPDGGQTWETNWTLDFTRTA
jgi:hypothetical protein